MALFNYATREITLKVVYYGPGLSGKTTNLQRLHSAVPSERRGRLLSLSTETDRTLFFDFLPVDLGKIKDFSVKFQLYTVPGQVRYNATRKVVLKGADAVVFVADSQREMAEENAESLENLRENLSANNIDPEDVPIVLQYNKRDLKNILPVEEMDRLLNPEGHPTVRAQAVDGIGVDETFRLVTRLLLKHISERHRLEIKLPSEAGAPQTAPPPSAPEKAPPLRAYQEEFSAEAKMPAPTMDESAPEEKPFPPPAAARPAPEQKNLDGLTDAIAPAIDAAEEEPFFYDKPLWESAVVEEQEEQAEEEPPDETISDGAGTLPGEGISRDDALMGALLALTDSIKALTEEVRRLGKSRDELLKETLPAEKRKGTEPFWK